jgi:hypothetical protein
MSDPQEFIIRGIIDGVLLKLGDIILVSSPGLFKKGIVVTLLLLLKKNGKKKLKHKERKK